MVSAIILAAGSSERMGEINKLHLPFRSSTVITHVVEQVCRSKAQNNIVVTGYEATLIQQSLKNFEVAFRHNPDFHLGLTSSIQAGIANAKSNGLMICLADMVNLTSSDYDLIIDHFEKSFSEQIPSITVPVFKRKKGNPVIFSYHFKEMILNNTYPHGCKNIIDNNSQYVQYVEMPDDHICIDIDFPEDYTRIVK